MPKFQIDGADPATGFERIVILEAADAADAQRQAQKMGISVARVQPFGGTVSDASPAQAKQLHAAPLGQSYHDPEWLAAFTKPLFYSAIGNTVFALIWGICVDNVGWLFAVAMTAGCICEFKLLGEAPRMPADFLLFRARRLAVFEIVVGFFNGISLACGILLLRQLAATRPAGSERLPRPR